MRNVTALAVRPRYQKCFFIWDTLAKVSLYPRRSLQVQKCEVAEPKVELTLAIPNQVREQNDL